MQGQYSLRSPAVKRLMKEAQELKEPTEQYHAQPLDDNLFEWHFTLRGPVDSDFNGGIYHGRIILPPEYPMKPPSIVVLTSNGRFEIHTKICLSISGHHPESWQPSWSIRTALLAILGFMPTHGGGAIGSLDYTPEERKRLAKKSLEYKCPVCGSVNDVLRPMTDASLADSQEAKELASQIAFQGEKEKGDKEKGEKEKGEKEKGEKGNITEPHKDSAAGNGEAAQASAPVSTPASGSTPSTPQSPTFPGPPWSQMPAYNPFMPFMQPPGAPGTRPNVPGSAQQTRPFMPFAQFAAMQSMMQQMQQAQRPNTPGFGFNAMRMPGTFPAMPRTFPGMPGTMPAASPTLPTTSVAQENESNSLGTGSSTGASSASNTSTVSTSSTSTVSSSSASSTEPTPSASSQSVSQSPGSSTSTESVRQRSAASSPVAAPAARPISQAAPVRSAELRARVQARSAGTLTRVVMAMLALAILFLFLRRLSMMGILKFDQDAEL